MIPQYTKLVFKRKSDPAKIVSPCRWVKAQSFPKAKGSKEQDVKEFFSSGTRASWWTPIRTRSVQFRMPIFGPNLAHMQPCNLEKEFCKIKRQRMSVQNNFFETNTSDAIGLHPHFICMVSASYSYFFFFSTGKLKNARTSFHAASTWKHVRKTFSFSFLVEVWGHTCRLDPERNSCAGSRIWQKQWLTSCWGTPWFAIPTNPTLVKAWWSSAASFCISSGSSVILFTSRTGIAKCDSNFSAMSTCKCDCYGSEQITARLISVTEFSEFRGVTYLRGDWNNEPHMQLLSQWGESEAPRWSDFSHWNSVNPSETTLPWISLGNSLSIDCSCAFLQSRSNFPLTEANEERRISCYSHLLLFPFRDTKHSDFCRFSVSQLNWELCCCRGARSLSLSFHFGHFWFIAFGAKVSANRI